MSKKEKIIIGVAVLVAGIVIYKTMVRPSRSVKIMYLIKNNFTTSSPILLASFGTDYIDAWYGAAKSKQITFTLGGKIYNTTGGTVKQ